MIQLSLTLKMTTTQVVKTSITVSNNSPIQDYIHPDDQTQKLEHMCRYQYTIDISCTESKRKCGKQHSCFCKAVKVVEDFIGYALKEEVDLLGYTGLLIGCGKKWEILRHFQGKLCGKKGLLCGKLCDFFKADLTLFF